MYLQERTKISFSETGQKKTEDCLGKHHYLGTQEKGRLYGIKMEEQKEA